MKNYIRILRGNRLGRKMYGVILRVYHVVVSHVRRRRLRRNGQELLAKVVRALEDVGVEYYVYWGTLLGIIRDDRFIASDDDIDIMVNRNSLRMHRDELVKHLLNDGFRFSHLVKTSTKILCCTFTFHKVHVDLFCFDETKDGAGIVFDWVYENPSVSYAGRDQSSTHSLIMPSCKPGKIINFLGVQCRVPSRPEETLACAYGPQWKVPISGWKTPDNYYTESPELAERYTKICELSC